MLSSSEALVISFGDSPPILLFWLQSMGLDPEFWMISENEPCASVVGAVWIELTLKVKVVADGEACDPRLLMLYTVMVLWLDDVVKSQYRFDRVF